MFFLLHSCVALDIRLHCGYDFHRYQSANVPDVVAAARQMHAGDVHSMIAASVIALGYGRDRPSKYSR